MRAYTPSGCSQHCLLCTSSNYCEQCEDDFVIAAGGVCERSCELGYYHSPYATQCLGKTTLSNHGNLLLSWQLAPQTV